MFRLKNIRLEVKLHLYLKTSAAWQIMANSNVKTKPPPVFHKRQLIKLTVHHLVLI